MDEEVPYADISYEDQLPPSPDQTASTSLKERIGNRIYLLEDSRKRKLVDADEVVQDEDEGVGDTNADLTHRSNALLLHGPPISQLPTARIFAYATHFDAHPIGLEWVDDQTCVLVFTSRKQALQAWDALRRPSHAGDSMAAMKLDDGGEGTLFSAPPIPLALYPIEERINSALGTQKSAILRENINIRWALSSDVKQPGARNKSEFYKKHGETAGKEGMPGLPQPKRRRHNEDDWDKRRKLDADLDSFLDQGDEEVSANLSRRMGGQRRQSQDEEARRELDDELDSFLAHSSESHKPDEGETESLADSRGPSLMDRTTRPLPRRARGGRDTRELKDVSENGRWLHNAERTRRRPRREYDEVTFGMRAWREDGDRGPAANGARPSKKPGKTQEELDRELEEFLGA